MITIMFKVISWFTNNIRLVAISFIIILVATIFFQYNQLQKRNKELSRITNNVRAYEEIIANKEANNRVLQLTIEDLKSSKDSILEQAVEYKKKLKVKDKNLKQIQVINTEIKDTVTTVIKHKLLNFKEELKINHLTTIIVSRTDSILTAKIDLKNQQYLFVEEKKEYRNRYKNGFVRFLHLDFKKIHTRKYQIVNTNPLIKVTDTRVVEVTGK